MLSRQFVRWHIFCNKMFSAYSNTFINTNRDIKSKILWSWDSIKEEIRE